MFVLSVSSEVELVCDVLNLTCGLVRRSEAPKFRRYLHGS